jgi:membrane protein YdbS with pleckstrin-like domain
MYTTDDGLDEIIFRPFLFWYLVAYGLLFVFGAACLALAFMSSAGWWLAGVALASVITLLLLARYNAQAVIVRGNDLVLRAGTLVARERIVPIWEGDLEIDQGPFGRLFDYATVRRQIGTEQITVPMIAQIRALRMIVTRRRRFFLRMLAEHAQTPFDPRMAPRPAPQNAGPDLRAIPSRVPR